VAQLNLLDLTGSFRAPPRIARLDGFHLVAGMPVEVFVQTTPRTVASFLVKPRDDQLARVPGAMMSVHRVSSRAAAAWSFPDRQSGSIHSDGS
jgi:hypothetical protein